jgi:hypothetical protein
MEGERIARALSRIKAAAARIESAAARPVRAPSSAGDSQLERKYAALRSETGAALQELDRLIGTLEQ